MIKKIVGDVPASKTSRMIKKSVKTYIEEKIKILGELGIRLNDVQLDHIWSLRTEIAVDRYARDLILGK